MVTFPIISLSCANLRPANTMNPKEIHNAHCSIAIAQRPIAEGVSAQDKALLPRAVSRQRPRVMDFPPRATQRPGIFFVSCFPDSGWGSSHSLLRKDPLGPAATHPKALKANLAVFFKHVWYQEAPTGGSLRQLMSFHQLHFLTKKTASLFFTPSQSHVSQTAFLGIYKRPLPYPQCTWSDT